MQAVGDRKWCPRCSSTKHVSEYATSKQFPDGLAGWCRQCQRDASRKYRLANPDKCRRMVREANARAYERQRPERRRRYDLWLAKRFWSHVNIVEPDECWFWRGPGFDKDGYGMIRPRRAHRVSWEYAYGPIEGGLHVLHRCDNPPCVNPLHLFLGTDVENVRDAISKSRRFGISDALREELRALVDAGFSQAAAARQLGISNASASRALHGRR